MENSLEITRSVRAKKSNKQERERQVLLGLVDYFLKTGRPVGSNTLKEAGFEELSAATIRNYFATLEEEGYLSQNHISGGRLPTEKAYRLYAHHFEDALILPERAVKPLKEIAGTETKEITPFLQQAAETLASLTEQAVFLSAPRFDQDFVVGFRLVPIDPLRCLCVIITDFGVIKTEVLNTDKKMGTFSLKRLEGYFNWRLTGHSKPEELEPEEEAVAQKYYNEIMVRYIVGYSNFIDEELYRTGFSRLLSYPQMQETLTLSTSLSLFENAHSMRLILRECMKLNKLRFWIGSDLATYSSDTPHCSVIAAPYHINKQKAGAIGILGPTRQNYRETFAVLQECAQSITEALTRSVYKFKISVRQPQQERLLLTLEERRLLGPIQDKE